MPQTSETMNQITPNAISRLIFRINRTGICLDFKIQQGKQTKALDEMVGNHIDAVLPPHVAALAKYHTEQAFATGTIQIFEYQLWESDQLHYYEARLGCTRADEVLVVVRDITYDKQAESPCRLSQESLLTVEAVEAKVPIILFSSDCTGVSRHTTGKGLEKLGLTPDRVVEFSGFEACQKVPEILEKMQSAQPGETFTVLERVNKAVFERTYIPYYDASGAVLSVIGVVTDITERVRVEEELARARQQLAERQESERLHLARELHDTAVQQLLSVKYQLEALQRNISHLQINERRSAVFHELLQAAQREVLSVVSQLRGTIGELRPAGLEELGLIAALEGYISNLQRQYKASLPKINLDVDRRGGSLPQPIALCLFRVIQEAYRNILKHANALVINTRLRVHADVVVLTISDNGCGFKVPARLSELTRLNHFGLAGMTERVALVRGQLTIYSEPGRGTEVIVRIPLQSMEGVDA